MSLHHVISGIQHQADAMIQNPKVQIAAGTAISSTPLWASHLQLGFGLIAAFCGAVIGLHGVYKIFRPVVVRLWKRINKSRGGE